MKKTEIDLTITIGSGDGTVRRGGRIDGDHQNVRPDSLVVPSHGQVSTQSPLRACAPVRRYPGPSLSVRYSADALGKLPGHRVGSK